MRKTPFCLLAGLLATTALLAAQSATAASADLISNGDFAAATTAPKSGYLRAATSWAGSGQKNVGVDASGGLWLGVTTPVFTGNLSRTGWDVVPNASQTIKVPAGCKSASLSYQVEFVGALPQPGAGLRISVGKQSALVGWSASPRSETVALQALPAGSALVDLASIQGARQVSGVRAGIIVRSLHLTCP